jgi:hypothetical protein
MRPLFGWAGVMALAWLLTAAIASSNAADNKVPKTSIPKIANIAGIQIGYSSMDELEGHLGKGQVAVGGHPNGARLWRVKGTAWVIYADAFCYSDRGAVVDEFDIKVDANPGDQVPAARLSRDQLAWAGGISLGMDEEHLLKVLRQNSWTPVKVDGGWRVEAQGHSPLTSDPLDPFNHWEVRFTMKGKVLTGISLDASVKNKVK